MTVKLPALYYLRTYQDAVPVSAVLITETDGRKHCFRHEKEGFVWYSALAKNDLTSGFGLVMTCPRRKSNNKNMIRVSQNLETRIYLELEEQEVTALMIGDMQLLESLLIETETL
jgi:hypothetical protein